MRLTRRSKKGATMGRTRVSPLTLTVALEQVERACVCVRVCKRGDFALIDEASVNLAHTWFLEQSAGQ